MDRTIRIEREDKSIPPVSGVNWQFPVKPEDTGGRLALSVVQLDKSYSAPIECHGSEDKFFFMIDGEMAFVFKEDTLQLKQRDLLVVPRGTVHSYYCSSGAKFILGFSPGSVQQAYASLTRSDRDLSSMRSTQELSVWGVHTLDTFHTSPHPLAQHPIKPSYVSHSSGEKYWLAGDEYTVKISGDETAMSYCIVHFNIPPGGGPIPHTHLRDEEIFYILSGEASLYANGTVVNGGAGDTVILPRGIPHAFRNDSDKPTEFLTIVTPAGFDEFIRRAGVPAVIGQAPPKPGEEEKKRLMSLSTEFGLSLHPEVHW